MDSGITSIQGNIQYSPGVQVNQAASPASRSDRLDEVTTPAAAKPASRSLKSLINSLRHKLRTLVFIENDSDRQTLLDNLRNQYKSQNQKNVFYISSPAQLEDQRLVHTLISENGSIRKETGRLYKQEPVTVVLDLTTMTAGQIAGLNELLAVPSKFRGKPIGKNIRIVALMDDSTGRMVGPDCWRRLKRFNLKSVPVTPSPATDNNALLQSKIPVLSEGNSYHEESVIECFDNDDFQEKLFGGFAPDEKGEVRYIDGIMATVKENRQLVIKDAPWDNPALTEKLSEALRCGGYEANGQWISLPPSLKLFRVNSSHECMEAELKALTGEYIPNSTYALIDKSKIELLHNKTVLDDNGNVISYNPLEELAKGCKQLIIRDNLPDNTLRLLLKQFKTINKDIVLVDDRQKKLTPKKIIPFTARGRSQLAQVCMFEV
ncbi:hypothetical protein EZMO1_2198 [Endozoicomonas montiporae CL-33]|nr:hypothetical protein EZMO1_2198 [Endozoicomonas montiporae CL-33]